MFCDEISERRTIVWNGPMGVFEVEAFDKGTRRLPRLVADNGAASVDHRRRRQRGAVKAARRRRDRSPISPPAGGASLTFLEGKKLPGVEALSNK